MKINSKTNELIQAAKKHDDKMRELGLKLEEAVKAKASALSRQRYEESAKFRKDELALVKELELLLEK
jgi:hypothetical protein